MTDVVVRKYRRPCGECHAEEDADDLREALDAMTADRDRLAMDNAAILRVQADHQRYSGELIERAREAERLAKSLLDVRADEELSSAYDADALTSARQQAVSLRTELDASLAREKTLRFMLETVRADASKDVEKAERGRDDALLMVLAANERAERYLRRCADSGSRK